MFVRCPHCHQPIHVVDESSFKELDCPSCGSSFSLLGGTEATEDLQRGPRRVAHFQLLEELGIGRFGKVWKAKDTELDRTVAIKIPRKEQLSDVEAEAFLREARAAAQLRHQNIVRTFEIGLDDGTIYIANELIEGANLKQWLGGRPLPPRESAELCAKIADALHHAHEAGVIHRDLKPSNIMMDVDGEPHIMDFGLAKREAGEITMTVEGQLLGTPAYMPPEQASGKGHHADRRADVYALGVVLFEMLTGALPFRGEKRMMILQILRDEPPSPRKLNHIVPRDLETICLKCLEKDADKRYASAQLLADELRRFLQGQPIQARPLSSPQRTWRWCRRNPMAAALIGSLALTIILGFVAVTLQWQQATMVAEHERNLRQAHQENEQARLESRLKAEEVRQAAARETALRNERRRNRYNLNLTNAMFFYEQGRLDSATFLLEEFQSDGGQDDLRSFEWSYLWTLMHADKQRFDGHTSDINDIAYSWDGNLLATGSADRTIRLWDPENGSQLATLTGHADAVTCLEFSPAGGILASGSTDGTVILWDLDNRVQQTALPRLDQPVESLVFSAAGNQLVIATAMRSGGGEIQVWDVAAGMRQTTLWEHKGSDSTVAFSRTGELLAAAVSQADREGSEIRVWDAASFEQRAQLPAHSGSLFSIEFTPDGQTLFGAGMQRDGRGSVMMWNPLDGQRTAEIDLDREIPLGLALSRDGNTLAAGTLRKVLLWDLEQGKHQKSFPAHNGLIYSLAFSPDGQTLATAAISGDNTAKTWDVHAPANPRSLSGHTGWVSCLAFTSDGTKLATANRTTTPEGSAEIIIWDPREAVERTRVVPMVRDIYALAFSGDGTILAAACDDSTIKLYRSDDWSLTATLEGHEIPPRCLLFARDSNLLVSGDGEFVRLSPDGAYYDTFERPGRVCIWDIAQGKLVGTLEGHTAPVASLAQSTSGRQLATCCHDGTTRIWDWPSRQLLTTLQSHEETGTALAFNRDDTALAIAGKDSGPDESGTVKLFETQGWTVQATLIGHSAAVRAMAYSPDGKTLVTGTWDGTLRFWDPRSGQQRLTLKTPQINALAFSPSGDMLVTGNTNKTVMLWRGE